MWQTLLKVCWLLSSSQPTALPALAASQSGLSPICREKVPLSFSLGMELWRWMVTWEKWGSSAP